MKRKLPIIIIAVLAIFYIIGRSGNGPSPESNTDIVPSERVDDFDADFDDVDDSKEKAPEYSYELIKKKGEKKLDIFYVHWKSKDYSEENAYEFAKYYKEKYCKKKCNIYVFTHKVDDKLYGKYPLTDEEYIVYAEALVFVLDFADTPLFWFLKDFEYREIYLSRMDKKLDTVFQMLEKL